MKVALFLVFGVSMTSATTGYSQTDESIEAMVQTQQLLRDPAARAGAIKGNDEAKKVDAQIKQLTNSSVNQEKIFSLSADALKVLVNKTQGDPKAMQALIELAKTNPEAFFKSLGPDLQRDISSVAKEIEAEGRPSPPR